MNLLIHMICRLNSENKNGYNFFVFAIFMLQKSENNSVINADSEDIKTLVQIFGSPILKFLFQFWKCVGVTHMRGFFILKIFSASCGANEIEHF